VIFLKVNGVEWCHEMWLKEEEEEEEDE